MRVLGPLRLQTECDIYSFKQKTRRVNNKSQKRHLFLFDGGVLFCKKRIQAHQFTSEYYEYKLCIPINSLGFAECSKSSTERFELWDETRSDGYAIQIIDLEARQKWSQRLSRLTTLYAQQQQQFVSEKQSLNNQWSQQRPQSWTSESSTVSSTRSSTLAIEDSTQVFQQINFPER